MTLGSQSDLRFEVIDEPVVPLQQAELGGFLETIVGALIGSALDSAIGQIIDLDSLDLFGLRLQQVFVGRLAGAPSYLPEVSVAFEVFDEMPSEEP